MTAKELYSLSQEEREKFCGVKKCNNCKRKISDHSDLRESWNKLNENRIDENLCLECLEDQYYEDFGDFIDKNPIGGHRK